VALEAVIFVGLPAAGKTTFYQQRFAATHVHVSKDLWPKSADKAARQARELNATLAAGRSVVVDNTNPTAADRALVIAAAREHGARVIGYYFAAEPREAIGRNRGPRRHGARPERGHLHHRKADGGSCTE
jgi:predicted kinase